MDTQAQAITALTSYFYTQEADGSLVRYKRGRPLTKYVPVDGGFLRFEREDGQWVQYPFKVADEWKGIDGLNFRTKPQCFDMVYPSQKILDIYSAALQNRG